MTYLSSMKRYKLIVEGAGSESLEEKGRCWKGYKPVPGKKPYEKGSCEKIKENGQELEENDFLRRKSADFRANLGSKVGMGQQAKGEQDFLYAKKNVMELLKRRLGALKLNRGEFREGSETYESLIGALGDIIGDDNIAKEAIDQAIDDLGEEIPENPDQSNINEAKTISNPTSGKFIKKVVDLAVRKYGRENNGNYEDILGGYSVSNQNRGSFGGSKVQRPRTVDKNEIPNLKRQLGNSKSLDKHLSNPNGKAAIEDLLKILTKDTDPKLRDAIKALVT